MIEYPLARVNLPICYCNRLPQSIGIQTYYQGKITVDLEFSIYQQLQKQSVSISEFIQRLTRFIAMVEDYKKRSNINPYPEKFNRGIHILGRYDSELGIFPNPNLAFGKLSYPINLVQPKGMKRCWQ